MLYKNAYAVQMAYDVSDEEKLWAEKILIYLDFFVKRLDQAENYLDLMYSPFKESQETSSDEIWKSRALFRKYRDKVVRKFNNAKIIAFKAYSLMEKFGSDTQMAKINKSFVMSIDDLEKQANRFIDLFDDLRSADFVKNCVSSIDAIKKESAQLKQIVEDRIKNHIEQNILAKSWLDDIDEDIRLSVDKKTPFIEKLVQEREKLINSINKQEQ